MTKIQDYNIKTKDRGLKDFISEIVDLWNKGQMGFKVISDVPSDEPSDLEIRLYNSGGGAFRIYAYFPGTGWKYWSNDG